MIRKANLKQEGFKVMGEIIIPQGYKSALNLHDTQVAIKTVKDYFQHELTHRLHLLRVTAPLFVQPETGLNDNLNGVEHPVSFELKDQGTKKTAEIVQSLAKWKRYALHKYGFSEGEGIYTDMNAIRQDEVTDNIHSVYVDQWDWEKIMSPEERNLDFLKSKAKNLKTSCSCSPGFEIFLCCVSFIFHPPSADGLQFSEKQIQVQRKPPDMQPLR